VPYCRVAFATLARTQLAQSEPAEALRTVARALAAPAASTPEYTIDLLATRARAAHDLGDATMAEAARDEACALISAIASEMALPLVRSAFTERLEANTRALSLG
jgi:hypothetical protein